MSRAVMSQLPKCPVTTMAPRPCCRAVTVGSSSGTSRRTGFGRGPKYSMVSVMQCENSANIFSASSVARPLPSSPRTCRMLAIAPRRLRPTKAKMIDANTGGE